MWLRVTRNDVKFSLRVTLNEVKFSLRVTRNQVMWLRATRNAVQFSVQFSLLVAHQPMDFSADLLSSSNGFLS